MYATTQYGVLQPYNTNASGPWLCSPESCVSIPTTQCSPSFKSCARLPVYLIVRSLYKSCLLTCWKTFYLAVKFESDRILCVCNILTCSLHGTILAQQLISQTKQLRFIITNLRILNIYQEYFSKCRP